MLKFINNINKSPRFINIHSQICNKNNNFNIKINNTNLFDNNNSSFPKINKLKFTKTTNFQPSFQDTFNYKYKNNNYDNNENKVNDNNNEEIEEINVDLEKRKELIRLVLENPYCSNTIMNLCLDMDNQETIPNPFYTIENRGNRARVTEFSQLDFAKLALSIDLKNKEALELVCNYLLDKGFHGIYLFDKHLYNGKYLSLRKAAELYLIYSNGSLNSISNLILSLSGADTYEMITGSIISVPELILEGVRIYKDYPLLSLLTFYMSKNHHIILPTDDGDGNDKELNRMELFEILVESQKDNPAYLAALFHQIGLLLENKKDTIKLFGDQIFTKQTAFAKSIELADDLVSQLILTNKLVKYMNINDRVSINDVPLSRIDLLKKFSQQDIEYIPQEQYHLIESFKHLSKFYKLDGNIQESNRFEQLAEMETQAFKSYLIKSMEDTIITTINGDYSKLCHLLASEILKDGETVTFSYEPSRKFDRLNLARYAASNDSLVENYNCSHSKLMVEKKLYSSTEDCHTALIKEFKASPLNPNAYHVLVDIVKINGQYDITPNSPDSYLQLMNILYKDEINGNDHFEIVEQLPSKSIILSKIYSRLIALEPDVPENYLQLGIHLNESLVDSISIIYPVSPFDKYFIIKNDHNLSYTRKELFSKYLQLKYNTDSIDGILNSEPLAWYLLSNEMNNDEVLFGKSRKQMLTNIIENIDSSFSKAYSGLSDLIEIDDDSEKIQLILKAIQVESDLNIKSIHFNKLASTLVDNDQKVELIGDGRKLNKQQLLIESIEIYPRKNHYSNLKLLINTLVNSNDTVSLFGDNYDKTDLLDLLLVHLESDSKQNYLETFKIKSNIILNKLNNSF